MRTVPLLVALAGLAGLSAACMRPTATPPAPDVATAVRVPAPPTAHTGHAVGADAATLPPLLAAGRQVVRTTCAACHTEQPPMKTAPPLAMVAMHYRRATPDSAAAVARIIEWVRTPAVERSLLPAMAIERHGLMPALPLPDSTLRAAATYVMSLAAPGMRGQGMGDRGHEMHGRHGRPGAP